MTGFFLKLALFVALVFTTVSLIARALGSTQPPNPALRGFTEGCEDIPQPCWFGVVPGVTAAKTAFKLVELNAYKFYMIANGNLYFSRLDHENTISELCSNVRLSTEENSLVISGIFLAGCENVQLGNFSLIGFPEKILPIGLKIGKYYRAEIVEYELVDQYYRRREWSPNSKILSFDIGSSQSGTYIPIDLVGQPWHGFVPLWRYCQLETNYRGCPK